MLHRRLSLTGAVFILAILTIVSPHELQTRKESIDQENLLELTSNKVRLEHAARNGDMQTVQLILEHASDLHPFDKDRACIAACEQGHVSIVELLIHHNCNIHVGDGKLLKIAVGRGDAEMVRLLLHAVMTLGKYPFSLVLIDRLMNLALKESRGTLLDLMGCRQERKGRFKAITAMLYAYCRQMRAHVSKRRVNTAIEIFVHRIITNDPEQAQQVIVFTRNYLKNQPTDTNEQYCVNKIYEGIALALLQRPSIPTSFEEVDLEVE